MSSRLERKILIVGVGNPFRQDDGVGSEVIKILRLENNPDLVLIDGSTDGLILLDQVAEYERAIIVDAVWMQEQPGIVKFFTPTEAKIKIKSDVLSTHGFGLAEMLGLMEYLDIKTQIKIIGIQPKDISFGEGLSSEVQSKIPQILDLIKTYSNYK